MHQLYGKGGTSIITMGEWFVKTVQRRGISRNREGRLQREAQLRGTSN
jgi:hypothetical protein